MVKLKEIGGWIAVAAISLKCPPLASCATAVMGRAAKWLGNPDPKRLSEFDDLQELFDRRVREIDRLPLSKKQWQIDNLKYSLMRPVSGYLREPHIIQRNVVIQIVNRPRHFGVTYVDKVTRSTRLQYVDYPYHIDVFARCPDGVMVQMGVPIPVLEPMLRDSGMRRPQPYSYEGRKLSGRLDLII